MKIWTLVSRSSFTLNHILDLIDKSVQKYSNHPSILKIKSHFMNVVSFTLNPVSLEEMETETERLNPKKAATIKNVPPKIPKNDSDICSELLRKIFNNCIIEAPLFLMSLSFHKQKENTVKKNYRPISVLPTVSEALERLLIKQVEEHMESFLSIQLRGFCKGYNTQQALVRFLENFKLT